jgi:hypothetical protein
MSYVYKTCVIHGDLKVEDIYLAKRGKSFSVVCNICRKESTKKCHLKNREIHLKNIENNSYENITITKICKKHGELKIHEIKIEGKRRSCRLCLNNNVRAYEKRYPERHAAWKKDYDKRIGKELKRKRAIVSTHNITIEQYDKMLEDSKGLCAICGNSENKNGKTGDLKPLSLDHCHECEDHGYRNIETIRGFLCQNCNSGMGWLGDDEKKLMKAIKFLRKHKHVYRKPSNT